MARPADPAPAQILTAVEALARQAGEIVCGWEGRVRAAAKADGSLATQADLESEDFLRVELARLCPGDRICGEEDPGHSAVGQGRVWSLDPLDGTHNFIAGLPIWAVSVGLIEGGRPALGVVHAPRLGMTFTAAAGAGAWLNGEPLPPAPAHPLEPNDLVAVTSEMPSLTVHLPHKTRNLGSAALHGCLVASGALRAAVLYQCALWDLAAAFCVLAEVEAEARTWDGARLESLEAWDVSQRQDLIFLAPRGLCGALVAATRPG